MPPKAPSKTASKGAAKPTQNTTLASFWGPGLKGAGGKGAVSTPPPKKPASPKGPAAKSPAPPPPPPPTPPKTVEAKAPPPASTPPPKGPSSPAPARKTEGRSSYPCKFHQRGHCKDGDTCRYAHGPKKREREGEAPAPATPTIVLMAHDPRNTMVTPQGKVKEKWYLVNDILSHRISGVDELIEAIEGCSPDVSNLTFHALRDFVECELDWKDHFFATVLPWMQQIALTARVNLPLLRQGARDRVVVSEYEVLAVLTHCFFCIVPFRNHYTLNSSSTSDYQAALGRGFANVNFSMLYASQNSNYLAARRAGTPSDHRPATAPQIAKLHCLFHYFREMHRRFSGETDPEKLSARGLGKIEVIRTSVDQEEVPIWATMEHKLCALEIHDHGTIEDDGAGMLQVDFANKLLGGGVLGRGCVQEEIRFLICPELLISRVVCEALGRFEAVVINGARRFSNYEGYGGSFKWGGPHNDSTKMWSGVLATSVVAMDALNFRGKGLQVEHQYYPTFISRETTKAHIAFRGSPHSTLPQARPSNQAKVIATGNWGCGVFGGDVQLKALLQLCGASVAECKAVRYFTYRDPKLAEQLREIHTKLVSKGTTVGEIYRWLLEYGDERDKQEELRREQEMVRLSSMKETEGIDVEDLPDTSEMPIDVDDEHSLDKSLLDYAPLTVFSHILSKLG